jgi:plastocyanin
MKKTLFLVTMISVFMNAVLSQQVHKIKVSDFQFSPKTVNAVVGDKIKWVWVNGKHTTTSTTIPNNVNSWDKPINKNHKTFTYTVKKAGTYQYQCNFHFSLGMVGTIKVTRALEAGLNSFEIDGSGANTMIKWKTTSSKEVAYFSVQKSTDGDSFSEIAKVYSDISNQYHITDNSNTSSKYVYYQIEMVDIKGEHQLSEIKMYTQKTVTPKLITSISPNPINNGGHIMLQFNADKEGAMLVQLYNGAGSLIKQSQMSASVGLNNGHFHFGDLVPGTYYIVCTLNGIKEKHIVIVK